MFVCEQSAFDELLEGLKRKCKCCTANWKMTEYKQKIIFWQHNYFSYLYFQISHVVIIAFKEKQLWTSSHVFGGRIKSCGSYYIFYYIRLVHAFTCAGILPAQYLHFSDFVNCLETIHSVKWVLFCL